MMPTVSDLTPANDVNATGPMPLEDDKHRWLIDADHAISALAVRYHRTGQTFTADNVRESIGAPDHPNWWGVAFAAAKQRGLIEAVAFGAARAKSRNGGSLKIWRAAR